MLLLVDGFFFAFTRCTRRRLATFPGFLYPHPVMSAGKRILAVDYGQKNIGLACSDELGLTVQPLPSIVNPGRSAFLKKLRALVRGMEIERVVIGMPVNMDGSQGNPFIGMQQLMKLLEEALKIPVSGVDERLSTIEALGLWHQMGPRRQKRYRTVDSLAAALILERYLRETS